MSGLDIGSIVTASRALTAGIIIAAWCVTSAGVVTLCVMAVTRKKRGGPR